MDGNESFAHIVDTQSLAYDWDNSIGHGKWSVTRTAVDVCGLQPMTSQMELKGGLNARPVHHNAQDDAFVTLQSSCLFGEQSWNIIHIFYFMCTLVLA